MKPLNPTSDTPAEGGESWSHSSMLLDFGWARAAQVARASLFLLSLLLSVSVAVLMLLTFPPEAWEGKRQKPNQVTFPFPKP